MKWNDLDMKTRAALIKVGVANGLFDILSIRDLYNLFAEGGPETTKHNTDGPIDWSEIRNRQAWAESRGNDKAVSPRGARGRYLIMPSVLEDYNKKNKTEYTGEDLDNPVINTKIRDSVMDNLSKSTMIDKPEAGDSVKVAKLLAAYNWGRGNLSNYLVKLKAAGVDIYDSWDWIKNMPSETRNYVNFILRNLDTGAHRTNASYRNRKKK